jgi:hypothetical protein
MIHTTAIRTVDELDGLPNHAVVYDHNNEVWQKIHERDQGLAEVGYGYVWFRPGNTDGYLSGGVKLPARLLDDGL